LQEKCSKLESEVSSVDQGMHDFQRSVSKEFSVVDDRVNRSYQHIAEVAQQKSQLPPLTPYNGVGDASNFLFLLEDRIKGLAEPVRLQTVLGHLTEAALTAVRLLPPPLSSDVVLTYLHERFVTKTSSIQNVQHFNSATKFYNESYCAFLLRLEGLAALAYPSLSNREPLVLARFKSYLQRQNLTLLLQLNGSLHSLSILKQALVQLQDLLPPFDMSTQPERPSYSTALQRPATRPIRQNARRGPRDYTRPAQSNVSRNLRSNISNISRCAQASAPRNARSGNW
jgi:hypothetical protein